MNVSDSELGLNFTKQLKQLDALNAENTALKNLLRKLSDIAYITDTVKSTISGYGVEKSDDYLYRGDIIVSKLRASDGYNYVSFFIDKLEGDYKKLANIPEDIKYIYRNNQSLRKKVESLIDDNEKSIKSITTKIQTARQEATKKYNSEAQL